MSVPLLKIGTMQDSNINNHWILITDEIGIASVFPKLKGKLVEARLTAITILYYSHSDQFLFQRELTMLERHFPTRLYTICESFMSFELCQATIEAVINVNTAPAMSFMISGNSEFTEKFKEILSFLGIQQVDIQEQFFSCL